MLRRTASNGTTSVRGQSRRTCSTSMPARSAAVRIAPSVPVVPGAASEHSATARSTARTPSGACAGPESGNSHSPPSGVHTAVQAIRPVVRVPVLSTASTVTDPSASAAGSDRTIAPRAAIRRAAPASASATTAGSASGIAATARLTPATVMSRQSLPCTSPIATTSAQAATTAAASLRPSTASRRCSGVGGAPWSCSRDAIPPMQVRVPVATTTAVPEPWVTRVPACTIDVRSPTATSSSGEPVGAVSRSDGCDSPVRIASSTCSANASISRASAPTTSPSASTSTSPGTRSVVGTRCWWPSRSTRTAGAEAARSAAIAPMARRSCATPTTVLTSTTSRITAQSDRSPVAAVSTAAASRTSTKVSRSWAPIEPASDRVRSAGRSLGPAAARRRSTSSADRPTCGSTPSSSATSAADRAHGARVTVWPVVSTLTGPAGRRRRQPGASRRPSKPPRSRMSRHPVFCRGHRIRQGPSTGAPGPRSRGGRAPRGWPGRTTSRHGGEWVEGSRRC